MVSKLDWQTIFSKFDFHWVFHTSDLVPELSFLNNYSRLFLAVMLSISIVKNFNYDLVVWLHQVNKEKWKGLILQISMLELLKSSQLDQGENDRKYDQGTFTCLKPHWNLLST